MAGHPRTLRPRDQASPPAASRLGPGHPLARASAWRSALAGQLVANTALMTVAAVMSGGSFGWRVVLSIAMVAELWLACGLALARTTLRELARDAIADGADRGELADVREIAAEAARLGTSRVRVCLADTLAAALHDAERWPKLPVRGRPPPAVRNLLDHDVVAREIIRLAREPYAPLRALALLDRLLREGYAGMVYAGQSDALGRELGRVRFLLAGQEAPRVGTSRRRGGARSFVRDLPP